MFVIEFEYYDAYLDALEPEKDQIERTQELEELPEVVQDGGQEAKGRYHEKRKE